MNDKIEIIFCKIVFGFGILASVAFAPFVWITLPDESKNKIALIALVIMSVFFFIAFWFALLKTNNPLTRYDPFSYNSNWKKSMHQNRNYFSDTIFNVDEPSDTDRAEFKRKRRSKILRSLLK
jgi:Na+/melibiose symporter-like transporter